jgi:uncharacterized protein (UPF0335 family)
MIFVDVTTLNLETAFTQLGMADYTLLQTTEFIDRLNEYRSNLMKRIGELQNEQHGKGVDESAELCPID